MTQITQARAQFGVVQIGIIVCTLATATIHLYLAAQPDEDLRFWFLLNGLGYLTLLVALYVPRLLPYHRLVRYALMAYAALTIILYFILGRPYDSLGYVAKLIELFLIVLLFIESRRGDRDTSSEYITQPSE